MLDEDGREMIGFGLAVEKTRIARATSAPRLLSRMMTLSSRSLKKKARVEENSKRSGSTDTTDGIPLAGIVPAVAVQGPHEVPRDNGPDGTA